MTLSAVNRTGGLMQSLIKTTTLTVVLAGTVALATFAQAQASQTRREPQFENENVRVWKSIIMPNQPLALHRRAQGRRARHRGCEWQDDENAAVGNGKSLLARQGSRGRAAR